MSATHTAVRDGQPVFVKVCDNPECRLEGVACEGSESDFYVQSRHADGSIRSWNRLCRQCAAAKRMRQYWARREQISALRRAQYAARMESDPEYVERKRASNRRNRRRARQDPVKAERMRAASREYKRRQKEADPEKVRGDARMNYALRAERAGRTLRTASTASARAPRSIRRLPAGPFREFLLTYRERWDLGSDEALAADLGIINKRVSLVIAGQPNVALDVVDRAILNARGDVRLEDLYPA